MSKFRILTYSFLGGIIITLGSRLFAVDKGDFISKGFPFQYSQGTWGMGYSFEFVWKLFLFDVAIWSLVSFVIVILGVYLKKRNVE